MSRVEQFEAIRRDHYLQQKSVREIARDRGIHRRKVRQALAHAVPPERRTPRRASPVLGEEVKAYIDGWLIGDQGAPRKQRHTARQIWRRLVRDHGFVGAESTIRRWVGRRRRELGLRRRVFVAQTYEPGKEAEVDWYEAEVDFPWGRQTVQFLLVRACFSGREFHIAFPRATQQAFLEGLVQAFLWFGGVFHLMRFDNLTSAVKRVLRGRRRIETDRFVALRSHYLFASVFCEPGIEGAHEKGGVEGGVGRFRRHHLVPVPKVADFDALNRYLRQRCIEDEARTVDGHARPIVEDWEREVGALLPLPAEPFCVEDVTTPRVDSKSRVCVGRNRYSVPVRLAHRRVEARVSARKVVIVAQGKVVARHERLQGLGGQSLDLDHYLELLQHKPGAMQGATALRQARDAGAWPACYDQLWDALRERYGDSDGTRQLIDVLLLHRRHDHADVHLAVGMAIDMGAFSHDAVAYLMRAFDTPSDVAPSLPDLGPLDAYGTASDDDISVYDQLLSKEAAA